MSVENHPNFHAVQFATDVTSLLFELNVRSLSLAWVNSRAIACLRGRAEGMGLDDLPDFSSCVARFNESKSESDLAAAVADFAAGVEQLIDAEVEKRCPT